MEGGESGVLLFLSDERDFFNQEAYEIIGNLGEVEDKLLVIADHSEEHQILRRLEGRVICRMALTFLGRGAIPDWEDVMPKKFHLFLEERIFRWLKLQPGRA